MPTMADGRVALDEKAGRDFLGEVLARADAPALEALGAAAFAKHRRVVELLDTVRAGQTDALVAMLRLIFSCRRRAEAIVAAVGPDALRAAVVAAVDGDDPVDQRFDDLAVRLSIAGPAAFDLPGELLHFADPDRHWLWTRWMWDPERETGALALLAEEPPDPDLGYGGAGYRAVGALVAAVVEWVDARGITLGPPEAPPSLTVDVLLACVYAVYMYTVLRMRMTQEFNRLVPPLPDLVGRLLGVRYLEG
jgi:hypothetical protein